MQPKKSYTHKRGDKFSSRKMTKKQTYLYGEIDQ